MSLFFEDPYCLTMKKKKKKKKKKKLLQIKPYLKIK